MEPIGNPGVVGVEVGRSINPERLVRKPADPIEGPGLPVQPTPSFDRPDATEPAPTPVLTPPKAVAEPRVDLNRDATVRIREAGTQVAGNATVPVADTGVAVETPVVPMPAGTPLVQTAQPLAAPVADTSAPALPMQSSALAERVMQAVELQANQPPPRTMVVDIPEIEGLRLVVSVRSGAEVHVVQSTSSTSSDSLQSFMDELQGVLADRGFVMTGDGRRRGSNPYLDERPEPQRAQRPTFRRPQPSDNDLRI
jgi:hypothetical protein